MHRLKASASCKARIFKAERPGRGGDNTGDIKNDLSCRRENIQLAVPRGKLRPLFARIVTNYGRYLRMGSARVQQIKEERTARVKSRGGRFGPRWRHPLCRRGCERLSATIARRRLDEPAGSAAAIMSSATSPRVSRSIKMPFETPRFTDGRERP